MEEIKNDKQLNNCTIYELWFDLNSVCVMAHLNNRILGDLSFFQMYAEMNLSNMDIVKYRIVDYDGSLKIDGNYSFMNELTWSCEKALSSTVVKEIEKCVKKIYADLRKVVIERTGQKVSCVVFEHSTKDSSCSYMPFVSYKTAFNYMKKKYGQIKNKHFLETFNETSISDDGSAEIKFADGNSVVWQIYSFSIKKGM